MDKRARRLLNERVDRGEALFDRVFGIEWDERVNLDTLNLGSPDSCVVGQFAGHVSVALYGYVDEALEDIGYAEAVELLQYGGSKDEATSMEYDRRWQVSHGFEVSWAKRHGYEYDDLTAEWILRIQLRRSQRALTKRDIIAEHAAAYPRGTWAGD